MKRASRTEPRKLADLHPYPDQRLFGDLSDAEVESLAEDMRRRGLDHPIHILPDGTIVQGHQRVRAAQLLGWGEIDVVVRNDLAGNADATHEAFICDNFHRRQLSPLAKARCARELFERTKQNSCEAEAATREYVGNLLGQSGRNVQRYLQVLRLPEALQEAFDQHAIGFKDVTRFLSQNRERQAQVALIAQQGGDLKQAMESLSRPSDTQLSQRASLYKLRQKLRQWNDILLIEARRPGWEPDELTAKRLQELAETIAKVTGTASTKRKRTRCPS